MNPPCLLNPKQENYHYALIFKNKLVEKRKLTEEEVKIVYKEMQEGGMIGFNDLDFDIRSPLEIAYFYNWTIGEPLPLARKIVDLCIGPE